MIVRWKLFCCGGEEVLEPQLRNLSGELGNKQEGPLNLESESELGVAFQHLTDTGT